MGKLAYNDLQKLLRCIGRDPRVIVQPSPGYDAGVHLIGDKYIVVSTDPCIGVPKKWFGWLLIHYASSDVALFGAKPEFCTINLLGPPTIKPQIFREIMEQTCQAAQELDMAIVTGHTGTYEGISTPIGVCTSYGTIAKDKLITPGGAKHGDRILCVKPIGLETVVNFALTQKDLAESLFDAEASQQLPKLVYLQSCVKEALLLTKMKGIHAMHDTTEGGLSTALNEMARASNVGFKIGFEEIPFQKEVRILQQHFKLSNMQMMSISSTGSVIVAVRPECSSQIQRKLSGNKVESKIIGTFTENKRRILSIGQKERVLSEGIEDPYGKLMRVKKN